MITASQRKPVFRAKEEEGILEQIVLTGAVCACILGIVYFSIMAWFNGWDNLVMSLCCLIFFFYARPGAKEFILYDDQLVVRRYRYLSKDVDDLFVISDIKELIFRTIRGKFGGPHIIIMCRKRMHETYRIDFTRGEIAALKHAFRGAGIVVKEDGL